MERKLKAIALSAIAMTAFAVQPCGVYAEADSTDTFSTWIDCNGIRIENCAECTVEVRSSCTTIDVILDITHPYSAEELAEITEKPLSDKWSNYHCIWYETHFIHNGEY